MSRRWLLVVTVLLTGCATVTEPPTTTASATTRPGLRSTTTTPDLSSTTTTVPEAIPSAEDILVDGEVSDEERELARWAVFTCLEEAGAETTFELYDVDPVVSRDFFDELEECRLPYVGLYRENRMPGDQFQLGLLGVVECTQDETGRDYGPKTVDEIGRLTPESHRTITAALNTDRPVYQGCYFDLYIAESRVLVDPEILGDAGPRDGPVSVRDRHHGPHRRRAGRAMLAAPSDPAQRPDRRSPRGARRDPRHHRGDRLVGTWL